MRPSSKVLEDSGFFPKLPGKISYPLRLEDHVHEAPGKQLATLRIDRRVTANVTVTSQQLPG